MEFETDRNREGERKGKNETKETKKGPTHITAPLTTALTPPQPARRRRPLTISLALTLGFPLVPPKQHIQHAGLRSGQLQLLARHQHAREQVARARRVLLVGGGAARAQDRGAGASAPRLAGGEHGGGEEGEHFAACFGFGSDEVKGVWVCRSGTEGRLAKEYRVGG